ncbi:hypothetical protein BGZ61DRAFT_453165 [Ilyonectria robusta]|uniref:uncharacterized protein n=1 Tax=Ilyonectria robusta TaxID=1079257 RepID=UPI001E8E677D|nr:uncharacterized protein BGZ61DRAFT_453165 [Ilyonectria robusta]KAH8688389.1 hypothetical protein BGZ61DRAFT_453165 [Ilyonectria robusta]
MELFSLHPDSSPSSFLYSRALSPDYLFADIRKKQTPPRVAMEEAEPSDTSSVCPALGSAYSSSEPSPRSSRSSSVDGRCGRVSEHLNDNNGPWDHLRCNEKQSSLGLQRPDSKESAGSGSPVIADEAEQFLSLGQDPLALPWELSHADAQTPIDIDVLLARPYGRTVPGQNPTFRSQTGVVSSQPERKKKKAPSSSSEAPPLLVPVPPSDNIPDVSPPAPAPTGDSFEVSHMLSSQSDVPAADLLSGPLSHNPSSPTLGDSYPWSSVHRRSQTGSMSDAFLSPPMLARTSDFGASSLRSESIQTPSDAPTRPAAAPFGDSHEFAALFPGEIPQTVYSPSQTPSIPDWNPMDNCINPSCLWIQPPAHTLPKCICPFFSQTSALRECPAHPKD